MTREIVKIDEEKCNGCGDCVPSCHEGAIKIVNGKAKLVADKLCDGLGACLGHCPQGAITIERRQADEFDEQAVAQHLAAQKAAATPLPQPAAPPAQQHGGCPGSRLMQFNKRPSGAQQEPVGGGAQSELTHWPVQLRLLPPTAPILRNARLLIAADCAPVACADFHPRLLRDRVVLLGCPKFDPLDEYVARLSAMIAANELKEIAVARMEVPCCAGILMAVEQAHEQAGADIPIIDIVVGTNGDILTEQPRPRRAAG